MIEKIESGPTHVVASGSVISFSNNPITITLGPTENTLKIIFEFKDEEGKQDLRMEGATPDSQSLRITLYNFKNPIGAGTTKPVAIGNLGGHKLYLHYRVYSITGEADKMLHYTFYEGEEVGKDGQS